MLNMGAGAGGRITKCRAALKTRPPVGTTRMKREESRAKGMENRKDRSRGRTERNPGTGRDLELDKFEKLKVNWCSQESQGKGGII